MEGLMCKLKEHVSLLTKFTGIKTKVKESTARKRRCLSSSLNYLPLVLMIPMIMYAVRSHHVITSRFDQQEISERQRDMKVCVSTIESEQRHLREALNDARASDSIRDVVRSSNPADASHVLASRISSSGYLVTGSTGSVLAIARMPEAVRRTLSASPQVKSAIRGGSSSGVVEAGGRVYMVAAGPIIGAKQQGAVDGALVVVRAMDSAVLTELGKVAECKFALFVRNRLAGYSQGLKYDAVPAADTARVKDAITSESTVLSISPNEKHIFASRALVDWNGRPVAVLTTSTSRATAVSNRNTAALQLLMLITSSLLLAVLGMFQMRARMLARHAHVDELTGLYNHRYMQERLSQEMVRCHRYNRLLSVALLDIDHFKDINDEYGHLVGDEALKHLAEQLQETVRSADVVARYGGEEFLIIMPETELEQAKAVAERVRQQIEESSFEAKIQKGVNTPTIKTMVRFTVSIGVSTFPDHAKKGDELIMAADLALFAAKRISRNAVMTYDVIAGENASQCENPQSIHLRMREGTLSTIRALAAAIDARDTWMKGHSEKVTLCALAIAETMGLPAGEMNNLRTAGLMHDVGRVVIPDSILNKPGKLTDSERELVARHAMLGAEILSEAPQLSQVADIVRHHHEQFDGRGYPDRMTGEEIPLLSRIIAVADAYDAMTSDRAHRTASNSAQVMKKIWQSSGTQFDPEVVKSLDELVASGRLAEILSSYRSEPRLAA